MQRPILTVVTLGFLAACSNTAPETIGVRDRWEVYGVEEGNMLKMRAGPGTGFDVYVGLPNGAIVRVDNCSRLGGTRWCKVALDRSPSLKGYVSESYLRPL